jgi:hypothetical protein
VLNQLIVGDYTPTFGVGFSRSELKRKRETLKQGGEINKREDRRNNQLVPFLFVGK